MLRMAIKLNLPFDRAASSSSGNAPAPGYLPWSLQATTAVAREELRKNVRMWFDYHLISITLFPLQLID